MRFVRAVPWHGPVLPFARQCTARVPHSTLPAAASSGKAQRKPQGIASELLRRSALGWKTAFPPDRASAQPGITKTVRALAFTWIFFRRRPARCSPATSTGPKTSCSSQAATGTTPQALSAMNAMIQLNVVALTCTRRSNGKPRTRKMPTLRGLNAIEGRSGGVARMPQPNQKER